MSCFSQIMQRTLKKPTPALKSMQLLCSALTGGKRLVGIDFGTRYIGVAVSDVANLICKPQKVFDCRTDVVFGNQPGSLGRLLIEYNAAAIVVGIPFTSGMGFYFQIHVFAVLFDVHVLAAYS